MGQFKYTTCSANGTLISILHRILRCHVLQMKKQLSPAPNNQRWVVVNPTTIWPRRPTDYTSTWVGFKDTTLVVIVTVYMGSCKSNYHKTTTAHWPLTCICMCHHFASYLEISCIWQMKTQLSPAPNKQWIGQSGSNIVLYVNHIIGYCLEVIF
jgi:hypothetical protein